MPDAREFAVQLDLEWAELMGGVAKAVQFVATEGLAMAQGLSPVDTGQFRANWLASVGQRDGRVFEGPDPAPAQISVGAIAAYTGGKDGFPVINLQNNLPYASKIEDGSSLKAPAGVVNLVAVQLEALWNRLEV